MAVKPSITPHREGGAARQPRSPRPSRAPKAKPPRNNDRFVHDMWGVGLIGLGCILAVSLFLFRHHEAGALGDAMAFGLHWLVGVGAYLTPLFLVAVGIMLIRGKEQHTRANFAGGSTALFLVFITWWHIAHTIKANTFAFIPLGSHGGAIGSLLAAALRALFNDLSAEILLLALSVMSLVWATDMRLLHILQHAFEAGKRVTPPVGRGIATMKSRAEDRRAQRAITDEERRRKAEKAREIAERPRASDKKAAIAAQAPAPKPSFFKAFAKKEPKPDSNETFTPPMLAAGAAPLKPEAPKWEPPAIVREPKSDPLTALGLFEEMPTVAAVPKAEPMPLVPDPAKPQQLMIPVGLNEDGTEYKFTLPPLNLLKESPPPPPRQDILAAEKQAVLMQTLNDFKIGANVAQVAMGPTITRYEVQLEPGILVKKIVALADNLAMSLAAIDVRVEAPIPGKAAIGIEVPNDVTTMVSLRECLSTNEFMTAPSKLTFALGKDVAGNFKYADLTKMPHLLVGGSTNSGKSVCLNVIISSILYRATPREVKFVMIDPKRVELSLYDGIPHLLSPVIKDVKHAAGIFRSVLKEMETRYDTFARIGTRNIEGYNNRVPAEERLPFIVVVVDELADLMMQMGAEVETSICRLAQLARATGIHLVIATQRPSVDVVTGTIKANISSRIAFAVATQIDSRTIIDQPGADRLIGKGDMLYMPIDAAKPVRIQGCYVGERETEELVKYLRDQEEAVYTMTPSDTSPSGMGGGDYDDDGSSDELFEPAVRWLVMQGSCSTSSLQRKFKIGYTRAARLVETMEAKGIVGSQDGVKPREILLMAQNVEAFFAGSGQGDFGQG